jgi:tRNA-guanine transglycosylase
MTAVHFEVSAIPAAAGARAGQLTTPHGTLQTPTLCHMAPQATVKGLDPDELKRAGVEVLLADTYHLGLRPGGETIAALGGLHSFMSWPGTLISDDGTWALTEGGTANLGPLDTRRRARGLEGRVVRLDDDAVTFTSFIDGSTHHLTPEMSIRLQEQLGADLIQAFDAPPARRADDVAAAERSAAWARRSLDARARSDQALLAVVRGGAPRTLRESSADVMAALPFDGYVIGGVAGQPSQMRRELLEWSCGRLPTERPRLARASGGFREIFDAAEVGIDLIACVGPVADARRGTLYTSSGPIDVTGDSFREDFAPIDHSCGCPCCQTFSRSYLHHLFAARELLAYRLATIHNVSFANDVMCQLRAAIVDGTLREMRKAFFSGWAKDPRTEESA